VTPVLPNRAIAGLTAISLMLVGPALGSAWATTLITEHEAQLPANDAQMRSGIERGPDIIPIYPSPKSGMIQSPFGFRIKFEAHGNTRVNLDTLTIVYKRTPDIDLTARVMPFARPDGIDMPNAEVPAGTHRIWIFIKDSVGHEGRADIHFDVEK
jgi:hypothetical protein